MRDSRAPAPRRAFPVRQPRPGQLSLPGLLHAAENHPDLPALMRPVVFAVRRAVAEYRATDATGELVSETRGAR